MALTLNKELSCFHLSITGGPHFARNFVQRGFNVWVPQNSFRFSSVGKTLISYEICYVALINLKTKTDIIKQTLSNMV